MHRTDTLDCLTCVRGEIYLVTDTDEVRMERVTRSSFEASITPGATGPTNHACSSAP